MPKKRVRGDIQRAGRGRRRVDAPRPSTTQAQAPRPIYRSDATQAPRPIYRSDATVEPTAPAPPVPGRPLRPTQRAAAGLPRFTRTVVPVDIAVDYRHVMRDLRQIGVLAGGAFVILVGLAFVIR